MKYLYTLALLLLAAPVSAQADFRIDIYPDPGGENAMFCEFSASAEGQISNLQAWCRPASSAAQHFCRDPSTGSDLSCTTNGWICSEEEGFLLVTWQAWANGGGWLGGTEYVECGG